MSVRADITSARTPAGSAPRPNRANPAVTTSESSKGVTENVDSQMGTNTGIESS